MQPAPDANQRPVDPTRLPTEPLVSRWQGVAGGQSLTPIQSTIAPDPQALPPLPMKQEPPAPIQAGGAAVGLQDMGEAQEVTDIESTYAAEVDAPDTPIQRVRRTTRTIRFLFRLIEVLLLIRFFLKLVGANPASPFGIFLYGLTDPLVAPFSALFDDPTIGRSMIEFTTVLALIIYPIFGWVVERSIQLVFYHEQGGQQIFHKKRHVDHEGC